MPAARSAARPRRRSASSTRCAESYVAVTSTRPAAPASHPAITSGSVVTGTARPDIPAPPAVRSEHTTSAASTGHPAGHASSVWAASAIDGTSTTITPDPASRAAASAATRVLPVPHAMCSCPRPPPRRPATTASTAAT